MDSSVTAALLLEQGYKVVGVYMKNWSQDLPGMICPWQEDYQDAKRVAVQLGVDFKMYDFETEYRDRVVQYMIDEYQAGRTPNPDIMCNQEVKFKLFLDTALADGADMIATGHYARINNAETGFEGQPQLLMGLDKNKDQAYFLYRVTQPALGCSLFPLGGYEKPEVRKIATRLGLVTAAKKDSQGICFVGKVGIRDFLSQFVTTAPGSIIDQHQRIIGTHEGAIFYTIGQRHGLDVGGGLPYYVVGKSMIKNEVYVTTQLDDPRLWRKEMTLSALHWINNPPEPGHSYTIRTRYRASLINCQLGKPSFDEITGSQNITAVLQDEIRAITPGQSAVIYDNERVVGGGIVV